MAELLFEIFCEEIPARMQVRAGQDLVRLMDGALKGAGLNPQGSEAQTGPRRLTYVTQVETRSPDVLEERKGPRVGAPDPALEGFMRGAGLSDISEAETRSDKKGDFYVAVVKREGQDTADILKDAIPTVMGQFPWPKSMKSGDSDFRWVRPLRGLTILLDGRSLDGISVGGVVSDNQIFGHRQMGPGPFSVKTHAEYEDALNGDGHVITDRAARKDNILDAANAVCEAAGCTLVEDEALLDEVAGLVEWPVALLGDMDPAFLSLPEEVIRLTLKSHQKTFTVRGPDGKLAPHFVIIANLETPDGGATIKAGNAKVISARLSDAKFFQDQDRQKKLQDYYEPLDQVVFHKKLGSIQDKAERVAALAKEIAPHVGANPVITEKAARLAKCDLVTQSVIEFTSLQGKIGRWMYEAEGGHPDIAVAIEEHYKPQGPSDAVPTNPVAVAVALADKIDTLVGFWAIDEKPTGSKDPYALRRAALGVVRILLEIELDVKLFEVLKISYQSLLKMYSVGDRLFAPSDKSSVVYFPDGAELHVTSDQVIGDDDPIAFHLDVSRSVAEGDDHLGFWGVDPLQQLPTKNVLRGDANRFLHDRLKVYLRDQGHKHDVIDAVIAQGGDDLLAISQRVEALGTFLSNTDGENLVQGYKRAANILRAEEKKGELSLSDFDAITGLTSEEGQALQDALIQTRPAIAKALEASDYPAALGALADLREPIDTFFENVVVNADEAEVRQQRLSLLSAIVETFHQIADFSRLDG